MADLSAPIQVVGARELRKKLRASGDKDALTALREAHKEAAEIVVRAAIPNVPVRSGRLRSSVRALASQSSGRAKAGKKTVPYANAIHWGWPRRNIARRPFLQDALEAKRNEVERVFLGALKKNSSLEID